MRETLKELSGEVDFAVKASAINPNQALKNIQTVEDNTAKLERKIQQLIIISAELRADPDEVDLISGEILNVRQDIFLARQQIALAQLTPKNI
mgnify:FL=1